MHVTTKYFGNKRFQSNEGPATITMDAPKEAGGLGEGVGPKSLLLYGLMGCTGLDVVSILEKKKIDYDSFEISVDAEQTGTHPKVYKQIKLTFTFETDEAHRKDIERAITLSEKTFCGVSAMLSKTADMSWELVIK
ncbi:MAG: OsmC family protein [Deltaproteobacteria bacterium]|nr:OsmC family protein [Deltaproteobacteria bacterium]MBN2672936.1 OsmC family protein [Deltaproteobacteria bacterium]